METLDQYLPATLIEHVIAPYVMNPRERWFRDNCPQDYFHKELIDWSTIEYHLLQATAIVSVSNETVFWTESGFSQLKEIPSLDWDHLRSLDRCRIYEPWKKVDVHLNYYSTIYGLAMKELLLIFDVKRKGAKDIKDGELHTDQGIASDSEMLRGSIDD